MLEKKSVVCVSSLKKAALIGALALSACDVCGQQLSSQTQKPKDKFNVWQRSEFIVMAGSFHASDRETPYREINPGLLWGYHVNPDMMILQGGYLNSNSDFAPTIGTLTERTGSLGDYWGVKIGVVIGFAGYRKKQRNRTTVQVVDIPICQELPETSKSHGKTVYYARRMDGKCMEITQERRAKGEGNTTPTFAVFPTASVLYKGNGLFVTGVAAPTLGKNGGWGVVAGYGLRINPSAFAQPGN